MTTDKTGKTMLAPDGTPVRPALHKRLMAVKAVIEKANNQRISRADLASRLVFDDVPVCEFTAYKYVKLLGIKWHHAQPYRPKVDREKLRQVVPAMLKQGMTFYQIAAQLGCSNHTIGRFAREEALVEDGKRYTAKLSKQGKHLRKQKESAK